jgi:hypothetical protein
MAIFSQSGEKINDPYREDFIDLVIREEREVVDLTDSTRDKVATAVQKYHNDESRLISSINPIMAVWAVSFLYLLTKDNAEANSIISEREINLINDKYNSPPLTGLIQKTADNLSTKFPAYFATRKFPDGIAIGQRIKSVAGSTKKTMIDIITVGMKEGKSAKVIAGDLDNFLKPSPSQIWTGPFQWYREKFGYKVKKVPAGRAAGSLHFNSIRIARTEINYTYRQELLNLHDKKPWVDGFDWKLSGAHPKTDICDDWAAGSPYKDKAEVEGLGHTHCMCYITVRLKKLEDIEI